MEEPLAVREAERLGDGTEEMEAQVDREGGLLAQVAVEPDRALGGLEEERRPQLVLDVFVGLQDSVVVGALEELEFSLCGPENRLL